MSREKSDSGGGLSIQTLLISAAGAVAAATIVPLFWERGTVIATAMTPVVVALVSEALRKPAEKVAAVAPRVASAAPKVARRTATGAALRRPVPDVADTSHPEDVGARGRGPERFDPVVPAGGVSDDDPFGLRGASAAPRRPWWKVGLVTGLLAFVIGAGVVTASELTLFGGSVSGERGSTTLFSGAKHRKATPTPTPTPTGSATPDAKATPTATPSATATPSPSATPSATATPQATTTPPATQGAPAATPTPTP